MARLLSFVWCVMALIAIASQGLCSFSGLLLIPTTDIVPAGEYYLEYQAGGSASEGRLDLHLLNTQFGLSDRMEAGLDFDMSGKAENRFLPNVKYQFIDDERRGLTAAAGVYTVRSQIVSAPYVVMGLDMRAFRVFAGVQRADGERNWSVGADKRLSESFTIMADYTQGAANFSSVALTYGISERLSITAGPMLPNTPGDTQFSVQLSYAASWRR